VMLAPIVHLVLSAKLEFLCVQIAWRENGRTSRVPLPVSLALRVGMVETLKHVIQEILWKAALGANQDLSRPKRVQYNALPVDMGRTRTLPPPLSAVNAMLVNLVLLLAPILWMTVWNAELVSSVLNRGIPCVTIAQAVDLVQRDQRPVASVKQVNSTQKMDPLDASDARQEDGVVCVGLTASRAAMIALLGSTAQLTLHILAHNVWIVLLGDTAPSPRAIMLVLALTVSRENIALTGVPNLALSVLNVVMELGVLTLVPLTKACANSVTQENGAASWALHQQKIAKIANKASGVRHLAPLTLPSATIVQKANLVIPWEQTAKGFARIALCFSPAMSRAHQQRKIVTAKHNTITAPSLACAPSARTKACYAMGASSTRLPGHINRPWQSHRTG